MVFAMMLYTRNHHFNLIQKMFAMYFKYRGLTIRGFDALHGLGLTMSSRWTASYVEKAAGQSFNELVELLDKCASIITHDNVNIRFEAYSQRLGNQSRNENGTAATVFIKPAARPLDAATAQLLHVMRRNGVSKPMSMPEIFDLAETASERLQPHLAYEWLQILLRSPEFEFRTYEHRTSHTIKAPQPLDALMCGGNHNAVQFMLGTVPIDESSLEGNEKCINEWFRQLRMDSSEEQRRTADERVVFIAGDQLTAERIRGLYKMRAEDLTSFDRKDYLVPLFGWFHLQMAYANSLHRQYLGTAKGRGLQHAYILLKRKGLSKINTKGPFYHNLNEALYHVAEAHMRACWLDLTGAQSLRDLREKTPAELYDLSASLQETYGSSVAMDTLRGKPEDEQDPLKFQSCMWLQDVAHYMMLNRAISKGDVGIMEDMLPHLLFRFTGGGNNKYAIEVLELLQGLHREWPPAVR